jgi:hypothetical protein
VVHRSIAFFATIAVLNFFADCPEFAYRALIFEKAITAQLYN